MKKIVDITFDLETCSLASNAAIMQIAAIVWDRHAQDAESLFPNNLFSFECKIDLTSCWLDGFDFSESTQKWWGERPEGLREQMKGGDHYFLKEGLESFLSWLDMIIHDTEADEVILWAQGSDFDISVLRTALNRYDLKLPFGCHNFRDARTFIAEIGAKYFLGDANITDGLADHRRIYEAMPPYPEADNSHSADYDARRTSWGLWQCFSMLPDSE